ncbi:MAG: hypothetical protein L0287_24785 [Anaerolineae bacterium]|nr:hypothetical protein [Anaerolineae bacterium]
MMTSIGKIFEGLTRDKHTTKVLARDLEGQPVTPYDPTAVKWCAAGWLELMYPANATHIMQKLADDWEGVEGPNDEFGYVYIEHLQGMTEEFELWYREPNE